MKIYTITFIRKPGLKLRTMLVDGDEFKTFPSEVVYFLNRGQEVIYIGSSFKGRPRLSFHAVRFDSALVVGGFSDIRSMEAYILSKVRPKHNISFMQSRVPRPIPTKELKWAEKLLKTLKISGK